MDGGFGRTSNEQHVLKKSLDVDVKSPASAGFFVRVRAL